MDFVDILSIKKWTPMAEVVGVRDDSAFLGKALYKIQNCQYLQLSQFKGPNFFKDDTAPYVTGVYLISDDGAARRLTALAIEEDSGGSLVLPREVLPESSVAEYGSILMGLKRMKAVCQETAAYRIAIDGKFVHRTIETDRYVFYFRGNADDDLERPYAVLCKLQS